MSVCYPPKPSSSTKGKSCLISCNAIGGANKTCLVNCVSAEGAPDGIGGGGSQVGSEESDGDTAKWFSDQLWRNWL